MIDFAKVATESTFLKKVLASAGISLNINEAIASLAGTIRDHTHFQRIITETEPEMRSAFYESVRPHLKFIAKPLDVYISEAGQMAEREKLPLLMPDGKLQEFKPAPDVSLVEKVMAKAVADMTLTLTCSKCTKQAEFYSFGGETPIAVVMKARRAGWVYNPVEMTEHCPACMGLGLNG